MHKLILFYQQLRTSTRNASPVPLDVWLYSLIFSLGLIYIFITWVLTIAPPSADFTEYNSKRLSKLNDLDVKNVIKVVMLGDSRLRYATFADKEMEELLTVDLGAPVKVIRIVNNWAVFHDFSGLTASIFAASPDLIVIQANLPSKGRAHIANKSISREYLFWRYFKTNSWNPGDLNQFTLQHEMSCSVLNIDEAVEERKKRAFRWFHFNQGSVSQKEITQFLANTTARRIPILFISIPITTVGKKGLPSPPKNPVETVSEIPEMIIDSNYCDIVHMNDKGRAVYSKWLATLIRHKLKANTSL
jgi:hypothetical protein